MSAINTAIDSLTRAIINPLLLLMFGAAFVYFLYGIFLFVKSPEDGDGRKDGIRHMIYGVLGFVIMVSAKAIYDIVASTVDAFK